VTEPPRTSDTGHLDEDGKPCTRHASLDGDAIQAWAAVGSRISGFHHDSASKLQSLMMALDEASELLGDERPDVRAPLDTAMTALRELHALLTENRGLAKAPQRKAVPVGELLRRAATRQGVKLAGEPGSAIVHVSLPAIVHALALLLDLAGGALQGARSVDVAVTAGEREVSVSIAGTPQDKPVALANESIAIATFLLAREDGVLRCTPSGFVVQLPTTARSDGESP
jgi:hypothetical protein